MSLKHFTDAEVAGLDETLSGKLDQAREYVGFPIKITCGKRTPEQNAAVGGKDDSSHLLGLAADLQRPPGPDEAVQLAWALGLAGFDRIEIADKHFHVCVNPSKKHPCVWRGISK
ncbi:MAG: hypothetical protein A2Y38_11375 [Spirochaetes bacterium GWB1_59_5]|nr:MAG: hypothetical protein A2Y38_11375 [Spirochaetes bacterium GWB1_59_5]